MVNLVPSIETFLVGTRKARVAAAVKITVASPMVSKPRYSNSTEVTRLIAPVSLTPSAI